MVQLFDSEKQLLKILGGSSILQVRIMNQPYCLVNDQGSFFLIESNCPHGNYPMSDGKVNRQGEVICMWHSYRFNLQTGQEKFGRCRSIRTYPIRKNPKGAMEVMI
ncbi:MAG: Rieske (2Fe-2S) protein [Cyclobacteriaceae bacterium]